jgi:hypothetical protein
MKGLLLALGWTAVHTSLVVLLLRFRQVERRAALMSRVFMVCVPLFVASHGFTPPDLWVVPEYLQEPNGLVDIGLGLFAFAALFFGGTLQIYNLADRGFSLRILIDMVEGRQESYNVEEVARLYGGGRGIQWMYQKRLDDMVSQGLIAGEVRATSRGLTVGRVFGALQKFLQLDKHATGTPS